MYGLFTYKLLDFYGKCRQIYHGVFGIVFLRMHSSLFPRIFVLFPFRQNLAHEFYSLRIPLGGSSHLVINNHGHRMSPKGCRTPKQNGHSMAILHGSDHHLRLSWDDPFGKGCCKPTGKLHPGKQPQATPATLPCPATRESYRRCLKHVKLVSSV